MDTVFAMTPSDNYASGTGGHISLNRNYRKALPHEVAQLEVAEKKHGCEYKEADTKEKFSKGQRYYIKSADTEITVTNVSSNGTVQFKYPSVFGNTVTAGLPTDSSYLESAELLD